MSSSICWLAARFHMSNSGPLLKQPQLPPAARLALLRKAYAANRSIGALGSANLYQGLHLILCTAFLSRLSVVLPRYTERFHPNAEFHTTDFTPLVGADMAVTGSAGADRARWLLNGIPERFNDFCHMDQFTFVQLADWIIANAESSTSDEDISVEESLFVFLDIVAQGNSFRNTAYSWDHDIKLTQRCVLTEAT